MKKNNATAKNAGAFSFIGPDVVIEGNIRSTADMHVDGTIKGDLDCGDLVQGEGSHIKGCITASSVRIAGKVEGSIVADDLFIEASAHISGDCLYRSLSVATGAQVDGRFNHKDSDAADSSASTIRLIGSEGAGA